MIGGDGGGGGGGGHESPIFLLLSLHKGNYLILSLSVPPPSPSLSLKGPPTKLAVQLGTLKKKKKGQLFNFSIAFHVGTQDVEEVAAVFELFMHC